MAPLTTIEGVAETVDATNAKLLVEFDRPELAGIKFDYWVIDLGVDYEYAVVSSPSRGVFIHSQQDVNSGSAVL